MTAAQTAHRTGTVRSGDVNLFYRVFGPSSTPSYDAIRADPDTLASFAPSFVGWDSLPGTATSVALRDLTPGNVFVAGLPDAFVTELRDLRRGTVNLGLGRYFTPRWGNTPGRSWQFSSHAGMQFGHAHAVYRRTNSATLDALIASRIAGGSDPAQIAVFSGIVTLSRQRELSARGKAESEALRAEASKLLALAQLRLKEDPTEALAFATLARVVGVPEPLRVAEPTPPISRGEPYEQLVAQAYGQRHDLRAQASAIEVSRERKHQVLARYAPQINAQWQYPRLDTPTFANRDEFWVLTLNFQVPIFDGGVR